MAGINLELQESLELHVALSKAMAEQYYCVEMAKRYSRPCDTEKRSIKFLISTTQKLLGAELANKGYLSTDMKSILMCAKEYFVLQRSFERG